MNQSVLKMSKYSHEPHSFECSMAYTYRYLLKKILGYDFMDAMENKTQCEVNIHNAPLIQRAINLPL